MISCQKKAENDHVVFFGCVYDKAALLAPLTLATDTSCNCLPVKDTAKFLRGTHTFNANEQQEPGVFCLHWQ